jgi:hypothetical protein
MSAAGLAQAALSAWFDSDDVANQILELLEDNDLYITSAHEQTFGVPHEQTPITVGAWSAWVDAGLATIVRSLWQWGIPTRASCQGLDGGLAYVCFPAHPGGLAYAVALQDVLGSAVSTLTVDHDEPGLSTLRWEPSQTGRLAAALEDLHWPAALAWDPALPSVRDFYGRP